MLCAFERFGIKALSPSSLNAFRHNPAHWATLYLLKMKDAFSPSAFRGRAVKHGLHAYFFADQAPADGLLERPNPVAHAHDEALRSFDTFCGQAGIPPDDVDALKEREAIPAMVTQALTVYMGCEPPSAYQRKVEDWIDEAEIPMIGYIDFVFPGKVDDLKTTFRMPSEPSLPHLRQASLYIRNRNEVPRLTYVTPKKAQIFDLDRAVLHDAWDGMVRDAVAMRNLLARAETPLDVIRMLPVDHTDYVWGEGQLQAALSAQTYIALPKSGEHHGLVPT